MPAWRYTFSKLLLLAVNSAGSLVPARIANSTPQRLDVRVGMPSSQYRSMCELYFRRQSAAMRLEHFSDCSEA